MKIVLLLETRNQQPLRAERVIKINHTHILADAQTAVTLYISLYNAGLLYDHGHLARAVCCRVAKDGADVNSVLPSGYKLNHPWLGRVTVCDVPRETQKTKSLSLNWCYGDTKAEVTDGTKGLCYTRYICIVIAFLSWNGVGGVGGGNNLLNLT